MKVNFYNTRLTRSNQTILVRDKVMNYDRDKINCPKDTVRLMKKLIHINVMAEEYVYLISLNSAGKIIGICLLSKGTVNTSILSMRELYIRSLLLGSVSIIIVHNHPSGVAKPTIIDFEATKRTKESGELLGIKLADHIIIGGNEYYSFKENSLI